MFAHKGGNAMRTLKTLWLAGLAMLAMSVTGGASAGMSGGYVTDPTDLKPIRLPCNSIRVLSEDGERYEPLPTIRCNRFVFIDRYDHGNPSVQSGGYQQGAPSSPVQQGGQQQASQIGNGRYDDDNGPIEMATLKWVPAPWSQVQQQ